MKRLITAAAAVVLTISAFAQEFSSGYFLDNYDYKYRLNPAFQPDEPTKGFFGLGISNITVSPKTNVGLSSFLFPRDGKLVTGFNESVSASEFLGGLPYTCNLQADVNMNILTVGFRPSNKSFTTIELNLKSSNKSSIPTEFISFLKQGGQDDAVNHFDINGLNVNASAYVELAVGYSRKVTEHLKIGGRVKGLLGAAYANAYVERMSVDIPTTVNANAQVYSKGIFQAAVPMMSVSLDGKGYYDFNNMNMDPANISFPGWGLSFDLGATYDFLNLVSVSAALSDFGFFKWNQTMDAVMEGVQEFSMTGSVEGADFEEMFKLKPSGNADGKISEMLPATLRLGARVKMPFYRNLSVGALANFKFNNLKQGDYKYNELRIGATVTPLNFISLSANYAFTTYGNCFGAALNLNLGFMGIFVGMDALQLDVTPQFVPISNLNTTVSAGLYFKSRMRK